MHPGGIERMAGGPITAESSALAHTRSSRQRLYGVFPCTRGRGSGAVEWATVALAGETP
jgi:hypothetical protein